MKGHLLHSADEPSHEFIVAEKSPRRVCEGGRDDAGVDLFDKGFPFGIGGVKGSVVAERAPSGPECAVPVRAGKVPVKGEARIP